MIFEILLITLFSRNLFREYTILNIINTFYEIRINYSFRKKEKKIQKKIFFLSSLQKILQLKKYSRWKINIQSIFGQHKILYQKVTKKIDFRNTLNHFFFEKFTPWIYDIEHYKHFLRDQNNLVISRRKKKNIFRHH